MQAIDHASVNTLRFLAADQVEEGKIGGKTRTKPELT